MDEARGEEAAQCGQQQECILSGGVYLRHRLGKASLPKNLPALLFPYEYYVSSNQEVTASGVRRSGVLACKKLSHI